MEHNADCHSNATLGELTIQLNSRGECAVTVTAPFVQALATMRLAVAFLENVLRPGDRDAAGAPVPRLKRIVERSAVPAAGSF